MHAWRLSLSPYVPPAGPPPDTSRPELVRTYPKLYRGTHTAHPAYERHRVRRVTLAAPGIVAYADGERFGPLPLTVECVPGALEVVA